MTVLMQKQGRACSIFIACQQHMFCFIYHRDSRQEIVKVGGGCILHVVVLLNSSK